MTFKDSRATSRKDPGFQGYTCRCPVRVHITVCVLQCFSDILKVARRRNHCHGFGLALLRCSACAQRECLLAANSSVSAISIPNSINSRSRRVKIIREFRSNRAQQPHLFWTSGPNPSTRRYLDPLEKQEGFTAGIGCSMRPRPPNCAPCQGPKSINQKCKHHCSSHGEISRSPTVQSASMLGCLSKSCWYNPELSYQTLRPPVLVCQPKGPQ